MEAATHTTEMKKIRCGFLIKEMLDRFKAKTMPKSKSDDKLLWLYSAHDNTIINLLNTLNIYEVNYLVFLRKKWLIFSYLLCILNSSYIYHLMEQVFILSCIDAVATILFSYFIEKTVLRIRFDRPKFQIAAQIVHWTNFTSCIQTFCQLKAKALNLCAGYEWPWHKMFIF